MFAQSLGHLIQLMGHLKLSVVLIKFDFFKLPVMCHFNVSNLMHQCICMFLFVTLLVDSFVTPFPLSESLFNHSTFDQWTASSKSSYMQLGFVLNAWQCNCISFQLSIGKYTLFTYVTYVYLYLFTQFSIGVKVLLCKPPKFFCMLLNMDDTEGW